MPECLVPPLCSCMLNEKLLFVTCLAGSQCLYAACINANGSCTHTGETKEPGSSLIYAIK